MSDELSRAAPAAAQLDADNLPPPLTDEQIGQMYLGTRHIGHATNRELAFGRAIEDKIRAPYAERIRLLERELAGRANSPVIPEGCGRCPRDTPYGPATCGKCIEAEERAQQPAQSIGDDLHFCDLITELHAAHEEVSGDSSKKAWAALCSYIHEWAGRAYIDGRTAGTASEVAPELAEQVAAARHDALFAARLACDLKYEARVASGHPREASTARALSDEISAMIAAAPSTQPPANEVKNG